MGWRDKKLRLVLNSEQEIVFLGLDPDWVYPSARFRPARIDASSKEATHMAAYSSAIAPTKISDKKRVAILVIHGIGEQNPYETLDGFARGLHGYYRRSFGSSPVLRPERVKYGEASRLALHLEPPSDSVCKRISMFEYYWAPETEDKVTYWDSLLFLLRTGVQPLRGLSTNLQEFFRASEKPSALRVAGMFVREIYRAVLIFIPLLFLFGLLAAWLAFPPSLSAGQEFLQKVMGIKPAWATAVFVTCGVMEFVLALLIARLAVSVVWRRGNSMELFAERSWFVLASASLMICLVLATTVFNRYSELRAMVLDVLSRRELAMLALTLIAVYGIKNVLTGFIGDIAVYVTSDEKSKNYAARRAILTGSCALAKELLGAEYDEVIIAGHSLGSLIAYDTVNKLIGEASTDVEVVASKPILRSDALQKLTGLLTFGSPLDKVYYFFREQVRKQQSVRAQILSYIHPFRRRPSFRDYGPYRFAGYAVENPRKLKWVNIWSPLDPVSGNLNFYNVDSQLSLWYWLPGVAHVSYWDDARFHDAWANELLEGGAASGQGPTSDDTQLK